MIQRQKGTEFGSLFRLIFFKKYPVLVRKNKTASGTSLKSNFLNRMFIYCNHYHRTFHFHYFAQNLKK